MTSKLSILSNHAEHPKGLAPFVIHATPFYNSKISTPNGSASSFGEDGETGQSLDTVEHFETAVEHLETSTSRPMGNRLLYPTTHTVDAVFSASEASVLVLSLVGSGLIDNARQRPAI